MHRLIVMIPTLLMLIGISACSDEELRPIAPGMPQPDEATITGENDPVAAACASEGALYNPQRVLVTRSPEWGTIWRADFTAVTDGASSEWRFVCWSNGRLLRPLEMFDTSQSIPPLP
jgi:hypothetical protein